MRSAVESGFDLQGYLAAERAMIEAARHRLAERFLAGTPPAVAEPIRYVLDAGGKRLRPVLCVAAYRAARHAPDEWEREVPEGVYEIACGLELVHTYSLVHDDLPCMDDDDLRRGLPTAHRAYGEAPAIVAGASLIPLATLALEHGGTGLELEPHERMRLVRELCSAAGAGGMVGGQMLDLEAERSPTTLDGLESIHGLKTGALLAAAARIGGAAARAEERIIGTLGAFGLRLGLAFQIADDVLDVTSTTATLGKTAGRDRALAKSTYPALLGVNGARARARMEADTAVDQLRNAGIRSGALEALARYAVERDR